MSAAETVALPEEVTEVTALIERARVAQASIANYTQDQVDELIRAMVWSCAQPGVAEELAQQTRLSSTVLVFTATKSLTLSTALALVI